MSLSQSQPESFFVSRQRAVNLSTIPVTVTSTGNSRLTAFCFGGTMTKEVVLNTGEIALVDDDDFEKVNHIKWYVQKNRKTLYATNTWMRKITMMHRLIMGNPKDSNIVVDHINGNGLDNRKSNLRLITRRDNVLRSGCHSHNKVGYKGVRKFGKKYYTYATINGKQTCIGKYTTPEEAAHAYDDAVFKEYGEIAYRNFNS